MISSLDLRTETFFAICCSRKYVITPAITDTIELA